MKNAVIIHGMPSEEEYKHSQPLGESHKHWIPWLQKQLHLSGIPTQTPEMPVPYHPVYEAWKETFEKNDITSGTTLIGHSCGGGFLLRYLSENKITVNTVALIAPWIDPSKSLQTGFFDFSIDKTLSKRIKNLFVFYSTDDDEEILKSISLIKERLPQAQYFEFRDKGHFVTESMKTSEFPELLTKIVPIQ